MGTSFPNLKTSAQKLRYLDLLADVLVVSYKGINVKVLEPAVYVLQKLLIQDRRRPDKKAKDMEAIVGISRFLFKSASRKSKFREIYDGMPIGWQKKVLKYSEEAAPELHRFLKES